MPVSERVFNTFPVLLVLFVYFQLCLPVSDLPESLQSKIVVEGNREFLATYAPHPEDIIACNKRYICDSDLSQRPCLILPKGRFDRISQLPCFIRRRPAPKHATSWLQLAHYLASSYADTWSNETIAYLQDLASNRRDTATLVPLPWHSRTSVVEIVAVQSLVFQRSFPAAVFRARLRP